MGTGSQNNPPPKNDYSRLLKFLHKPKDDQGKQHDEIESKKV
jgi:hypothetical protein